MCWVANELFGFMECGYITYNFYKRYKPVFRIIMLLPVILFRYYIGSFYNDIVMLNDVKSYINDIELNTLNNTPAILLNRYS